VKAMALAARIALAEQALAQRLAPVGVVLQALEIPRASWYYARKQKQATARRREGEDRGALRLVEAVLAEHPEYGYRRVCQALRRRGEVINPKRVQRLLREHGLALLRKARKPKPNALFAAVVLAGKRADLRSLLARGEPGLFELLYTDFTLLAYAGGRAWLVVILDHASRALVGWALGQSPSAAVALQAWERAKATVQRLTGHLPQAVVHHDQGGAFLSHEWVGKLLLEDRQKLSYTLLGAKGNPVVESFFGRLKSEAGDLFRQAKTWEELSRIVAQRLAYYHNARLHMGLAYRTPKEVMDEALAQRNHRTTLQKPQPV